MEEKRHEELMAQVGSLLTELKEQKTFKKQKMREMEEEEMIQNQSIKKSSFNVETGIKNILQEVMHPELRCEEIGHTDIGREPIYHYTMDIPLPNCIKDEQLVQLKSLQDVVAVEMVESLRNGCVSVLCVVSKDSSLKVTYSKKDLLQSKIPMDYEVSKNESTAITEKITDILEANLVLIETKYDSISNRTEPNGMDISILTKGVKAPISLSAIRRIRTHGDAVIINCFFKAASVDNTKMLLVLEMFDG